MGLKFITITGADDNVDPEKIIELNKPFVEWGILIYPGREPKNRFPSLSWIINLEDVEFSYRANVNKSLHICGPTCDTFPFEFLDSNNKLWDELPSVVFERIQLNMHLIDKMIQEPHLDIFSKNINMILNSAMSQFIVFQSNENNDPHLKNLMNLEPFLPIDILYDSSRGNGVKPTTWNKPKFGEQISGYAGGIGPENIENVIQELNGFGINYWLDMETGVRDAQNHFDLNKVKEVINVCEKYIERK